MLQPSLKRWTCHLSDDCHKKCRTRHHKALMPTLGQVQLVSEEKQVLPPSFNIIKEQACYAWIRGKVGERAAAPSYYTHKSPPTHTHTPLLTDVHIVMLHPQNNTDTVLVDTDLQVRALGRSWVCLRTHLGDSRDVK